MTAFRDEFRGTCLGCAGMLVLEIDGISKNGGTPKESETGAAGCRAIKQLESEGLVDPDKIGLITWSHMGSKSTKG